MPPWGDTMPHRLLLGFALATMLVRDGSALDIAFCHLTVPDGETGILQADIACGGEEAAVKLGRDAKLQMNGHRITSGQGGSLYTGIDCEGATCTVAGPGEIDGFDDVEYGGGIGGEARRVYLSDLDLHHNRGGVLLFGRSSKVVATNVTVHDNAGEGIHAKTIFGDNLTATGNGGVGLDARWIDRLGRVQGTAITASGNGMEGIFAGRVTVDGLVVQGNGRFGLNATRVRLANATLDGNSTAIVGEPSAVDLVSTARPSLLLTACGHSARVYRGLFVGDWDVCTND